MFASTGMFMNTVVRVAKHTITVKEIIIETQKPPYIYAIDVDGVLADFILDFTLIARRKFNTPVIGTHSQREWNMSSLGLNGDQLAQVWQEINESPTFWLKLKSLATPEELMAIDMFTHEPGTGVHFITQRCGLDVDEQTTDWLHQHGICAEAVHVVNSASDKAKLAVGFNVNIAIDDRPETVVQYAEAGIPNVYLMRRQYNQPFEYPGVKVIGSLIEFVYDDCLRRGLFDEKEKELTAVNDSDG